MDNGDELLVASLSVDDPDVNALDNNDVYLLLSCAVGEGLALYPW